MTVQRAVHAVRLPTGFVWGAATSAFQIEGAARTDGKGESIWDRYCAVPGNVKDGATGEVASDHYGRWREDVALMARLGLSAYRFSVAWSRVLPEGTGRLNAAGLDFYDRLVDGLLDHGIEPWLTLYHWDLPQALEDAGGWPDRRTAGAFGDYTAIVSKRLGDRVRHWMTVNEPWEIGFLGYHQGIHAPGRKSLKDALASIHTVLLAHGMAVEAIRANSADPRVGIAIDLVACYPDRDIPADASAAKRLDGYFNRWFLDPLSGRGYPDDMVDAYGEAAPVVEDSDLALIATPLDFVGLNYYYSHWAASGPGRSSVEQLLGLTIRPPQTSDTTGMGWAVHPAGLEGSLVRLARQFPGRDLIVTESGAAYDDRLVDGRIDDTARIEYHAAYLEAVARAATAGAPVRGYFAWSLLDNLEWSEGFGPRFGLVAVDRATLRRTVKASGAWYRDVIAANGFA